MWPGETEQGSAPTISSASQLRARMPHESSRRGWCVIRDITAPKSIVPINLKAALCFHVILMLTSTCLIRAVQVRSGWRIHGFACSDGRNMVRLLGRPCGSILRPCPRSAPGERPRRHSIEGYILGSDKCALPGAERNCRPTADMIDGRAIASPVLCWPA